MLITVNLAFVVEGFDVLALSGSSQTELVVGIVLISTAVFGDRIFNWIRPLSIEPS